MGNLALKNTPCKISAILVMKNFQLWSFKVAKFRKISFLQIPPKRFGLEQNSTSYGPIILAVLWGVTETTFFSKMHRFGDIAQQLCQVKLKFCISAIFQYFFQNLNSEG